MAQWIGYMVSIKCKDDLGTFQGEISSATSSSLTLMKAFCNGFPCPQSQVKIEASDIVDVKLLEKLQNSPPERSTVTIAKPIAKRAGRTQSTSESKGPPKSKPIDIEQKPSTQHFGSFNESGSFKNTPNKSNKNKKYSKGWKDEQCFGFELDHRISKDFDFEKNLALFDKQAIWEEINNSQKPDVIKHVEKKPTKYRHDENVIATLPTMFRQIQIPKQEYCEYVTDDGLIIPSVSQTLRKKLWQACDRLGLNWERRAELMGRAATEISIQLLGGGHRLNPHNTHQFPTVVIFCGPNKLGAMGLNAARQLASHGVKTIVYTVTKDIQSIKQELSLYMLTKNKLISSVQDLPSLADLIIVALNEENETVSYPEIIDWVNKNRAPVLALDPPSVGTAGITPKFSLVPVLPLLHSPANGKLYLCNLGLPMDVFNEVGIKYKSPFGSKFFIPLHPKTQET